MKRVYFSPGYPCNNDCVMCGVPRKKRFGHPLVFSTKEAFSFIDKLDLKRGDQILFSGGEPTIRPDFLELCRYALRYPSELIVLSNGRRFADREFAEEFSKIGKARVVVPVFSDKPKIHDQITRRKGSFLGTIAGLNNLQNFGVPLSIKFIALKLNFKDAPSVMRLVLDLFPKQWTMFCGIQVEGEVFVNSDRVAEKHSVTCKEIEKAIDLAEENNYFASIHMVPMCCLDPAYWRNYSIGTYHEDVVAPDSTEINSNSQMNFEEKPKACKKCLLRERCVWAWRGYSRVFGLNELGPVL